MPGAKKGLGEGSVDWLDRAAVCASGACMAHCLALPLVVAALPALSSVLAAPEAFHLWMLALAVPAAAVALVQGRARHGAWAPLVVGAAGLVLLATGALVLGEGRLETAVTVAGGVLLATAHVANRRLRRACARRAPPGVRPRPRGAAGCRP